MRRTAAVNNSHTYQNSFLFGDKFDSYNGEWGIWTLDVPIGNTMSLNWAKQNRTKTKTKKQNKKQNKTKTKKQKQKKNKTKQNNNQKKIVWWAIFKKKIINPDDCQTDVQEDNNNNNNKTQVSKLWINNGTSID